MFRDWRFYNGRASWEQNFSLLPRALFVKEKYLSRISGPLSVIPVSGAVIQERVFAEERQAIITEIFGTL